MTPTFVVTSAINTNVGTFSLHQRIFQTAATVQSIMNHYPDALIVLMDGGQAWDQNDPMWQELKSRAYNDECLVGEHQNKSRLG